MRVMLLVLPLILIGYALIHSFAGMNEECRALHLASESPVCCTNGSVNGYDVSICTMENSGLYSKSLDKIFLSDALVCGSYKFYVTLAHEACHRNQYLEGREFDEEECYASEYFAGLQEMMEAAGSGGCGVQLSLPTEPPPDNCWEADVQFSYAVHDCEKILGYATEVELCDFEYSFIGGFYNFSSDTVYVSRNTCLPKNYTRTILHELCHRKQYLEGKVFDELECMVGE